MGGPLQITDGGRDSRSPRLYGTSTIKSDMHACSQKHQLLSLTALSHVTTSGPQAAAQTAGDQNGSGDAAEYSRIGPS